MKRVRQIRKMGERKAETGGRDLEADLARLGGMAFGRLRHCGPLVKRFHGLKAEIEATGRAELIWRIYDWLLAPFSLWPEDFESMGAHVASKLEGGCWKVE